MHRAILGLGITALLLAGCSGTSTPPDDPPPDRAAPESQTNVEATPTPPLSTSQPEAPPPPAAKPDLDLQYPPGVFDKESEFDAIKKALETPGVSVELTKDEKGDIGWKILKEAAPEPPSGASRYRSPSARSRAAWSVTWARTPRPLSS